MERTAKESPGGILVAGAGLCGLAAAGELQRAGQRVVVIDKGRGPGGRACSRRIGKAVFDHGAQFLTAREGRFQGLVARLAEQGTLRPWPARQDSQAGEIRWRGDPSFSALPKALAEGLDLRCPKRLLRLEASGRGWRAELEGGEMLQANAVLLTFPLPQVESLLAESGLHSPKGLPATGYETCLALLAVLDAPSRVPAPGFLELAEGPLGWIADNQQKGISPLPALTLHSTAEFADKWLDRDPAEAAEPMLAAARPWLPSNPVEVQVHRWRYSRPIRVPQVESRLLQSDPPLLVSGDGFRGGRVEDAVLAGWDAGQRLAEILRRRQG